MALEDRDKPSDSLSAAKDALVERTVDGTRLTGDVGAVKEVVRLDRVRLLDVAIEVLAEEVKVGLL